MLDFFSFSALVITTIKFQQTHKRGESASLREQLDVTVPLSPEAAGPSLNGASDRWVLFYPLDFCSYKRKMYFLHYRCSDR